MNERANGHVELVQKPRDEVVLAYASTVYLAVQSMECPCDAMRVRNGLLEMAGVLAVEIFPAGDLVVVRYDRVLVETGDLIAAVAAVGTDGRHCYNAQIIGHAPAPSAQVQ